MMIVLDKLVFIAIAMAAYTAWKNTVASIHIGQERRRAGGSVLVSKLRTVNFIDALVAILTLQNTLIMVNRSKIGKQYASGIGCLQRRADAVAGCKVQMSLNASPKADIVA